MLQVGQTVTISKGAREIWTHFADGRPARYAPVRLGNVYRISAIEDLDGGGCKITMYATGVSGDPRISMYVSARGKLARSEITLNTGDPTKTIRVQSY